MPNPFIWFDHRSDDPSGAGAFYEKLLDWKPASQGPPGMTAFSEGDQPWSGMTASEELPAGWSEKFGMYCRPLDQTLDWPNRAELGELLRGQLRRTLELLAATSDEQLAQPADLDRGTAAISDRIIHGLHDEAKHSGEMYLILKLCRAIV